MNEIPATQALGEPVIPQTQEVNALYPEGYLSMEVGLWGKLISLTSDPCIDLQGKDKFSFGRHPNNDFVFPENYISSNHATIFLDRSVDPNKVFIVDTSTNGTLVNETRIAKNEPFCLTHGDNIGFAFPASCKTATHLHAFIFQDPAIPLRIADSLISQEMDGIEEKYIIEGGLGKGSFGEVKLCRERCSGNMYAAKIIDLKKIRNREDKIRTILREAEMLASLDHPGIPFMKEIIRGIKNIYIIMELVTGGDLFDRILKLGHFNEIDARGLMKNLLEVIQYLHSKGIVHRDIKPENVLMVYKDENVTIKVTDFGLAKYAADGLHTVCGTPQYFAPEIQELRGHQGNGSYNSAVDMWSVGVLLYVILAGELPFGSSDLSQQILRAEISFEKPVWKGVSEMAKDLIHRLIVRDPSLRLTAEESLRHPWIVNTEYCILGSQLASQLLSQQQEESALKNILCDECLSPKIENGTNSHSIQDGIVADSQVGDDILWRRPFPLSNQSQILLAQHSQQRFVIASSIDEEVLLDLESEANGNTDKREAEGLVTPEGKRPAVSLSSSAHTSPHSSQHSRQGTPFRTGLKAAVVASSIFDVVANSAKKEKKVPESPRKNRAKKSMIQSSAITNYFLKKQPKEGV